MVCAVAQVGIGLELGVTSRARHRSPRDLQLPAVRAPRQGTSPSARPRGGAGAAGKRGARDVREPPPRRHRPPVGALVPAEPGVRAVHGKAVAGRVPHVLAPRGGG